jgi:RNA polymerase sigma-70 factor (ECF subfamily)
VFIKAKNLNEQPRENSESREEGTFPLLSDEELVARARRGERRAMEALIGRYQEKAYTIAYQTCFGDREEAEDLTQEAFLRAFRSIRQFRGDSSFYTWFYRILINTCLDGRRRRRRWGKLFSIFRSSEKEANPSMAVPEGQRDTLEDGNPMVVLRGKQIAREVQTALRSLPERQRLAFQLKVIHGMSIREIAQVMGTAEGTIKSHLFRATQFLREALKEWE